MVTSSDRRDETFPVENITDGQVHLGIRNGNGLQTSSKAVLYSSTQIVNARHVVESHSLKKKVQKGASPISGRGGDVTVACCCQLALEYTMRYTTHEKILTFLSLSFNVTFVLGFDLRWSN